jgi:hypothetical protein
MMPFKWILLHKKDIWRARGSRVSDFASSADTAQVEAFPSMEGWQTTLLVVCSNKLFGTLEQIDRMSTCKAFSGRKGHQPSMHS